MHFEVAYSLPIRKTMHILAGCVKAKTVKKRTEQGAPEQTAMCVVIYPKFVCEERHSTAQRQRPSKNAQSKAHRSRRMMTDLIVRRVRLRGATQLCTKAKAVKKRAEQGAPEQTDDGVAIYSEFVCEEQRSSARNFDGLTGWRA